MIKKLSRTADATVFLPRYRFKTFALLEVIVVFVIIGILLSVAASTAIWLNNRTELAAAESSLNAVLAAQREASFSFSSWERDFSKLNLPKGPTVSLEESNSPTVVSSYINSEGDLFLATKSLADECIAWRVQDPLKGGATTVLPVPPSSFCSARSFASQYGDFTPPDA